jgi:hypothetical protein
MEFKTKEMSRVIRKKLLLQHREIFYLFKFPFCLFKLHRVSLFLVQGKSNITRNTAKKDSSSYLSFYLCSMIKFINNIMYIIKYK